MQQLRIGLLATVIAVVATQASAQQIPWDDRIFANVSFGVQGGTEELTGSQTFTLYEEPATINSSREVKGGSMFDLVIGGRVRGAFGVGLGFTRRQKNSPGGVEGSIPSPVRFEDPRIVSLTVD